jgi:4'-phosphopantetheinyl transferase
MSHNQFQHLWAPLAEPPVLRDGEVHVWSASLCLDPQELSLMREVLSPNELERCERSPLFEERNRFVAGRGLLRHLLAPYLHREPAEIQFAYGYAGKPYFPDDSTDVEFNISHSGDFALVAVTTGREVGVDVERICDMPEMDEMVRRFFSDSARAEYQQSATPADRLQVFFKCWTEKEAISKCTGQGIADEQPLFVENISVIPLVPAIGYAGALAISGPALKLRTWRWQHSCRSVDTEPAFAAATGVFL